MGTLKESPPDQLRDATEMIDDRLRIERLVRANARRAMVIDIIERLVEDPEREDFGPSDMEYWSPLHDALREKLRAVLAEAEERQLPPLPECYVTSGGRDLWREEDLIAYGRACAALAEPEVEPYIWYADDTGDTWTPEAVAGGYAPSDLRPLYTLPPRREWHGLTDEEALRAISPDLYHHIEGAERETRLADARAVEAALKDKNHD